MIRKTATDSCHRSMCISCCFHIPFSRCEWTQHGLYADWDHVVNDFSLLSSLGFTPAASLLGCFVSWSSSCLESEITLLYLMTSLLAPTVQKPFGRLVVVLQEGPGNARGSSAGSECDAEVFSGIKGIVSRSCTATVQSEGMVCGRSGGGPRKEQCEQCMALGRQRTGSPHVEVLTATQKRLDA